MQGFRHGMNERAKTAPNLPYSQGRITGVSPDIFSEPIKGVGNDQVGAKDLVGTGRGAVGQFIGFLQSPHLLIPSRGRAANHQY